MSVCGVHVCVPVKCSSVVLACNVFLLVCVDIITNLFQATALNMFSL